MGWGGGGVHRYVVEWLGKFHGVFTSLVRPPATLCYTPAFIHLIVLSGWKPE